MAQLITVIYDGEVLKPKTNITLSKGKEYKIQIIEDLIQNHTPERNHQSFLNGYASEDEGLYDEY
ncbi:hypothetical protein Cyast_2723 [Cyanobacterium stanieri PCC 7202]|uniref:DUF104 domain-containing protein n=1 Tax=Cyanobacterium stanieri (strain ATCC 29140 / PCC 7202) TaxID=292563 RepID=K9YQJ6_CYASC|nr:hypothetical protein Cyast_2723 [Cyanobacterium stanieri PCC 7202]